MPSHAGSIATITSELRRFRRNRRGSAAIEFALVAPVFIALLFAIIETAMVFFASQVLETGLQGTGRLFYTSQAASLSKAQATQDLCNRISVLFPSCTTSVEMDLKSYPEGTAITIADPLAGGAYSSNSTWQPPNAGSNDTVVLRAFYQYPLYVTGLGYNIANIGRDTGNSKRLLAATFVTRPQ